MKDEKNIVWTTFSAGYGWNVMATHIPTSTVGHGVHKYSQFRAKKEALADMYSKLDALKN